MLDAGGILTWVRDAKPGDVAVYARGERLTRQVSAMARRMQEQGLVDLTQKRDGCGWRFMMQRRSAPFKLAGRRRARSYGRASAETIILRMIRDAIRLKQPCPKNKEFADAANLAGAVSASYRLRKLVADGKIALIDFGPFERRVAVLPDTGQETVRSSL